MMKLMNNLRKRFLSPKKTRATMTATLTLTFEICLFAINNKSSHSDQFTIMMEIIQIVCDSKIDKTDEKIVEAQRNQGDGDSNTNIKYLKFVSFLSTIDQIILINLQPR